MLDIANQHPIFKDSTAQASWLINNTPAENYNPRLSGSWATAVKKRFWGASSPSLTPVSLLLARLALV
jgi:hypothetical protein